MNQPTKGQCGRAGGWEECITAVHADITESCMFINTKLSDIVQSVLQCTLATHVDIVCSEECVLLLSYTLL